MKGIPFSSQMVQALLNTQLGSYPGMPRDVTKPFKRVTRRIAKVSSLGEALEAGPAYQAGETYVVKEGLYRVGQFAHYQANQQLVRKFYKPVPWRWRRDKLPGIFMPTEVGRMWVQVMDARPQFLHDIDGMECMYEGLMVTPETLDQMYREGKWGAQEEEAAYLDAFATLIDEVGGAGTWAGNPIVWRYELKRVACPG